jgi:4-amino-4-deoxy-L-arabinose transferase-like glycosyltransferase
VAGARDDGGISRGLLLGAVCGLAVLSKPSNVVIPVAAAAALIAWGRRRTLLAALPTAAALGLPQLVYNDRLFGAPWRFAYTPSVAERYIGNQALEGVEFSPLTLPRAYGKLVLSNFSGPLLPIAVAVALVLVWRRFPDARWAVVGQAAGFAVLLGMYRYSVGSHFVRLLMPALPAVCLAAGGALVRRPGLAVRSKARAGPVAAGVALAAAAVAVALSVSIARAPATSELNVVDELAPRAEVSDGVVRLDWPELDAPATLRYEVRRLRRPPERGFDWELVPPDAPTIAAGETTEAVDDPGPHTWWYRVALVPSRDQEGREPGPPVAWSPAVRVVVR